LIEAMDDAEEVDDALLEALQPTESTVRIDT